MPSSRLSRFSVVSLVAAAAITAAGCRSGSDFAASIAKAESLGDSTQVSVVVQNQSLEDINIYVKPDPGIETRVGTVMSSRTDTLLISPDVARGQPVRFIARRVGRVSGGIRTQEVYLSAGDEVTLMVPFR